MRCPSRRCPGRRLDATRSHAVPEGHFVAANGGQAPAEITSFLPSVLAVNQGRVNEGGFWAVF
jgi:hypothetical protein